MTTIHVPFEKLGLAIEKDVENNISKIIISIFAYLDSASPIGRPEIWKSKKPKGYRPGWFKANWKVIIGPTNESPFHSGRRGRGDDSKARKFKLGKEAHIVNNVPYAARLADGWSLQAPAGWVVNAINSGIKNAK